LGEGERRMLLFMPAEIAVDVWVIGLVGVAGGIGLGRRGVLRV
jgi:hypothetical protein